MSYFRLKLQVEIRDWYVRLDGWFIWWSDWR